MTREQDRKLSYLLFISGLVLMGFLIHVLINGVGINRYITAFVLMAFIYFQLRTAFFLYRESQRRD